MARYGSRHRHLCQQLLGVFKDEGRLPKAIRFTGTTRNTPLEMGKYSHGFYHKATKDNEQLRYDLGVIRFGKRGKLNPRYIQPFKILAKVGTVAYILELSQQLSRVYNTFRVPNLKECLSNKTLFIHLGTRRSSLKEILSYFPITRNPIPHTELRDEALLTGKDGDK
ncbi:hypothetical protein Tco_1293447 [Tanacetum coccineum]